MIPQFPKFKRLELEDKEKIQKITSKFSGYSDFNFVSLWSYNTEDDIDISLLNENLIVKFRDYVTNERFFSFIGKNNIAETIDILLSYSKQEGIIPKLKLVPEESIVSDNELTERFHIQEDKDNHDYILSLPEHSSLLTSKFYKHRKLISKFHRRNPGYKVKELNLQDPKIVEELLNLFYSWEHKKDKQREDTNHELIALKRTIRDSIRLNLTVLGVYIREQIIGMVIADTHHSDYIESHFLKTNPDYNGLNHLFHHLLAKHLSNKGHLYINIEQDLGIEGLRKSKELSKPIKYLKKYTISKKSDY
jgi:uncharacterized protein